MAAQKKTSKKSATDRLRELARTASVMLDGEEVLRIVSPRAMEYISSPVKGYRFMTNDYFDVDHEIFIRTKKTMKRLARLTDIPCSMALWLPAQGAPKYMTIVVHNGTVNRYWQFGSYRTEMPNEVRSCLKSGTVRSAPGSGSTNMITVLAPVFDSLEDTVAVLEISALDPARAAKSRQYF